MAYAVRRSPRTVTFAPSGDAQVTSSGLAVVYLQQLYCGIPVSRALRSVRFSAKGAVVAFTGRWQPVAATTPSVPKIGVIAAARAALRSVSAREETSARDVPADNDDALAVVARFALPTEPTTLRTAADALVNASLAIVTTPNKATLAWHVRLTAPNTRTAYAVYVSADGKKPRVLTSTRLSAHAVDGLVFQFDPGTQPRDRRDFPQPRAVYPAFAGGQIPLPEWTAAGLTVGNNVDSVDSAQTPSTASVNGADLSFDAAAQFTLDQFRINAFYLCNFLHDFFLLLGFDEAAGNFQKQNATSSGAANDALAVIAETANDASVASFMNRADGRSSELTLRSFNGRHASLDASVVIHEYVHGVTDRVIGGPNNEMPLVDPQSIALGEGYSDYFAITIQNYYRRREQLAESFAFGQWVAQSNTGLRPFMYDATFTATYGQIGKGKLKKDHDAGQVWCAALLAVNRALELGGDRDSGDEAGWQLVFDSLKLLHGQTKGLTFLDGRNALIDAFDAAVTAGTMSGDPTVRQAVLDAFRARRMGPKAKSKNAGYNGITEDPKS